MLLWIPPDSNSHHNNGISTSSSNGDDDEKSTKVQRQARLRAVRTTLAIVGSALMVIVVMIVQLRVYQANDSPYESNLRRRRLPFNSIYRLSVLDAHDRPTMLDQFYGKVTLVVNTACS
jgi:hypothetical protein